LESRLARSGREFSPAAQSGTISIHVLEALQSRGASAIDPDRDPARVGLDDLFGATVVVALSDAEHRPMVAEAFPEWVDRIQWWEVGDIPLESVSSALPKIENLVRHLHDELTC